MVLKIVRYTDTEAWTTGNQFYAFSPNCKDVGLRFVVFHKELYPEQAIQDWLESPKEDRNWEIFRAEAREFVGANLASFAKLVTELNSYQDDKLMVLLVDDTGWYETYERTYEWCVEQLLTKGFSHENQRYQIHHTVENTLLPVHISGKPIKMVFPLKMHGRENPLPVSTCFDAMRGWGRCHTTRNFEPYTAYGIKQGDIAIATNGKQELAIAIGRQYRITNEMIFDPEYRQVWANKEKHAPEELDTFIGKQAWGLEFEALGDWVEGEIVPFAVETLPQDNGGDCVAVATIDEQPIVEETVCTPIVEDQVVDSQGASTTEDIFVALHCHSHYSDGTPKVPELVEAAAKAGHPAIALTDHGTMMGAMDLYEACQKFGIKPIIGNEMYLEHEYSSILSSKTLDGLTGDYKPGNRFHQIVLAKNLEGYRNLSRLTTWSELENKKAAGGKGKAYPLITLDKLKEHHEGLIVTSGCIGSLVPQLVIFGELELAREIVREYQDVFGEDYYIELQDHDGQKVYQSLNLNLAAIAQEFGIKCIVTPDSHFLNRCDYEVHRVLYAIKYGKKLSELENESFKYDEDLFFPNAGDLRERFPYLKRRYKGLVHEAIANTLEIAEKVQHYKLERPPTAPEFPLPAGVTPEQQLRALAEEGLRKRLDVIEKLVEQGKIKNWSEDSRQTYYDRLNYELDILHQKGFESYFLFVHDCVAFAKSQDIPTGAGRGSAAGSLVCYALEITDVDPVHHGLIFERFLNPERKSMPDIDSDFCQERRGEVINYVVNKYGRDKVAQIGTVNKLTSKAVVKNVASVLELPITEANQAAKMIPVRRGKPEELQIMIGEKSPSQEFRDKYKSDSAFKKWIDIAIALEGNVKTYGTHAAGVVISDSPLQDWIPLMQTKDQGVCTQYDMNQVEKMGFIKMDFLGLKNLTIVKKALEMVKQNRGEQVVLERLDLLEDEAVYNLYRSGETDGLFQFESSGMKGMLKELKPDNIEDLSAANALFRPGTLDAGEVPVFINRKHGRKAMEYMIPELEPILSNTYACLLYQEQTLKIAQDISDYTLGQADNLRRAIGKKKMKEMEKEKDKFVQGVISKGHSQEVAEKLFQFIEYQAEYSFNKSHSLSYAYQSLACAVLKAHYAPEFMSALMSYQDSQDKRDKVSKYLNKCRSMGIKILPPDVNASNLLFTPSGNDILFGFKAINGLGEAAIASILNARQEKPFESLVDFFERTEVNKTGLKALIYSGAFDSISSNRKQLIESIPLIQKWKQDLAKLPDRLTRLQESLTKRYAKLGIQPTLATLGEYEQSNYPLKKTKQEDVAFIRRKECELIELRKQEFFTMPDVDRDFTFEERLTYERDTIGFFVSGNPLDDLAQHNLFPVMPDEDSDEEPYQPKFKETFTVSSAIIEREDAKTSKAGKPYQVLQLEDHAGTLIKCLIHGDAVEEYAEVIDNKLAFTGVFGLKLDDEGYTAFLKKIV